MSKWSLPESDDALPLGRVIVAGLCGHCLAAFSFVFTYSICLFCHKFALEGLAIFANQSWLDIILKICLMIYFTGGLALMGAIIISPSLLVTLPLTLFAAAFLKTGPLPTTFLGAAVGVLVGLWLMLMIGGFHGIWEFFVSSAAGGIAFAWFVWRTCIRPLRLRLPQ